MHADRGDLARAARTSQTPVRPVDPRRLDLERADRADDRLLEVAAVALHVLAVPVQVEDRVADELAGPVEGRLAAAVGLDELDLGPRRDVHLARLGAASERDRRRVLEEEHRVGDRALPDRCRERPLERPGLLVADEPEVRSGRRFRRIHSRPSGGSVVGLAPALQPVGEVAQELAAVGAVDEAVVVGQRQVHHRPDRDRVAGRRRR